LFLYKSERAAQPFDLAARYAHLHVFMPSSIMRRILALISAWLRPGSGRMTTGPVFFSSPLDLCGRESFLFFAMSFILMGDTSERKEQKAFTRPKELVRSPLPLSLGLRLQVICGLRCGFQIGAHTAGYKREAPPRRGFCSVLLCLAQRHRHPPRDGKKEEKEGAEKISTVAHKRHGIQAPQFCQ
jgi:hypothetical protein